MLVPDASAVIDFCVMSVSRDLEALDGVTFRLLGPIQVVRRETELPLGGRRQRELLALLALDAGRPVSAEDSLG